MNNYTDYDFYKNKYGGDLVPSNEKFEFYCRRATRYIKNNTLGNVDEANIPDEVKMCCCELCELDYELDNNNKPKGIQSEKVGEYSVTFESTQNIKESYEKDQNKILRLWLADTGLLYRGC